MELTDDSHCRTQNQTRVRVEREGSRRPSHHQSCIDRRRVVRSPSAVVYVWMRVKKHSHSRKGDRLLWMDYDALG
jgi:hypothetical protein